MNRVTIASIQPPEPRGLSVSANEAVVSAGFHFLEEAFGAGATLCCLPEYFNVFGLPESHYARAAVDYARILDRVRVVSSSRSPRGLGCGGTLCPPGWASDSENQALDLGS